MEHATYGTADMLIHHIRRRPGRSHHRGVVLIGVLMVLIVSGSLLFLNIANNRPRDTRLSQSLRALLDAKEHLLMWSALNERFAGTGHGRLVCADGDNDGLPGGTEADPNLCEDRTTRLPASAILPDGSRFTFTRFERELDRQFWYRVSPGFLPGAGPVNSATPGELTLDGEAGIVAVIIAPGEPLPAQNRNLPDRDYYPTQYLELENSANLGLDTGFVSGSADGPRVINDQVIAIRTSDLMGLITPQIAETVYQHLETHWDTSLGGTYPADQAAFDSCMNTTCNDVALPAWYVDDAWQGVAVWQSPDTVTATLTFTGCAITYTLSHGAGVSKSGGLC